MKRKIKRERTRVLIYGIQGKSQYSRQAPAVHTVCRHPENILSEQTLCNHRHVFNYEIRVDLIALKLTKQPHEAGGNANMAAISLN